MIKTGFCVSYDWELLKNSLPRVYDSSDLICLSLDINRMTWSGIPFDFNYEKFISFIKKIDKRNIIDLYEEEFYRKGFNSRENGNYQRNMMGKRMGKGGWHVQIDADEYFVDFDGFAIFLNGLNPSSRSINVCIVLIDLFKKIDNGYLYIKNNKNKPIVVPVATNNPVYLAARRNGHFNAITNFVAIHETWGRKEIELRLKLKSYGHADEEFKNKKLIDSFISLWRSIDQYNYQFVKDFHFSVPTYWPKLSFIMAKNINELIDSFKELPLTFSVFQLFIENSRNLARVKHLLKKVMFNEKSN